MEDKKRDEIEKLMRSRLLDTTPSDEGWNVPPDHIFNEAMKSVPKKKKKRRR